MCRVACARARLGLALSRAHSWGEIGGFHSVGTHVMHTCSSRPCPSLEGLVSDPGSNPGSLT